MATSPHTLKLQTNVPETIALKFADGLPVSSNFTGDQIMFSLIDDRKLYLAPVVAKKIADAGIQQGELFQICKREVTHGNRRSIEYQISTDLGKGAATKDAPAKLAQGSTGVSSVPSVPVAVEASVHPQNTISPAAPAVPAALAAHLMATCYESAVDVALGAMNYAKTRGLHMSPTFEDIRTIAATFFIAETRNGSGVRS